MTPGVGIARCATCGLGIFPQPLLCPKCHGHEFAADRVHQGVVEEISVIRHMIGQENWTPKRIASVRTSDGQLVTVGLVDDAGLGATVELFQEEGAPFGRKKG